MTGGRLTEIWRHPIKSHGRERLDHVRLSAGAALPFDRHWAVLHDNARVEGEGWHPCQNFMIGTRVPGLAGLWARLDEAAARVELRHAALGAFALHPDRPEEAAAFFDWLAPILPSDRARPRSVLRAGARGMTDSDYPSVSLMNRASHLAVAEAMGRELEPERWRGNFWIEGLAPWAEVDLVGRELRLGGAVLRVVEPIRRCLHTAANPVTGARDADTLGTLSGTFGHQDFGVYAEVIESGPVALGDSLEAA